MRRLISAALVLTTAAACRPSSAPAPSAAGPRPNTIVLRGDNLARAKAGVLAREEKFRDAYDDLIRDANTALTVGPFTVTQKKRTPPSGDKHDYMSLAPYWWPDSSKPNGLPYVRHDGRRNPETENDYDAPRLKHMMDAVTTLGLAYYFTGTESYAAHAAQLLRVWFVAPDTRMNPRLTYAQAIPGITEGRGIGIIETRGLIRLLDAIRMLDPSPTWTPADRRAIRE